MVLFTEKHMVNQYAENNQVKYKSDHRTYVKSKKP